MKAYPIDSHVTFDEDGIPEYDRAITSEPLRKLIKSLFKTGIDPTVTANLQVAAGEGMEVVVRPGFAVVDGCMALEEDMRTLVVQASSNMYDRIDTVVLRLDDNDPIRDCDLHIVEGIPSNNPVRPDLTRAGSIYEIGLADIFVGKNSERILASKIVDTRYENARCGVMSSISEFNTAMLNQQMNAWSAEARAEFEEWVDGIKNILDANAAGHLQGEIEGVQGDIEDIQNNVESIRTSINTIQSNLTANSKKFKFAYSSSKGKYGYEINGQFYPFSNGAVLIGTYSSDTTINVSAYGATSSSQFLAVCDTDTNTSAEWGSGKEGNFGMGWLHAQAKYIAPTKSLSGSTLSLTVGKMTYSSQAPSGSGTATKKLPTSVYYVGDIESA